MLSHELRTPLTPVLAAARMMEQTPGLPAEVQSDAAIIRRNVELEARLIDDLLDLTRVAKGKLQLNLEAVNVHEAIDAVLEIFAGDIQGKELKVHVDRRAELPHVRADMARMQQMLWNIIKNAAKFTPAQGEIFIRTMTSPPDKLRVEVRDTGIGIEPGELSRLFTAFEQASEEITKRFGGLGLGLAITKALAELHGGRVWAESEGRGKGAKFILELPAVAVKAGVHPKPVDDKSAERKSRRILLVEDHPDTADVMTRLMRRMGHDVKTVNSVSAAMEKWSAGGDGRAGFDLLMSDVGLPDGTGLELIQKICASGSRVPAIALTGYGMEDDVQRCLDAGFSAHLTKPVDFGRLEELVRGLGER